MDQWLLLLGALLIGGAIGAIITIVNMRRRRGDEESIRGLRREFDRYQDEVTHHFVETAALVNNLTQSYKAVYDHLEQGAYRLVGEETLHKRLEGVEAEPVMLEYIGQRRVLDTKHEPVVAGAASSAGNPATGSPATDEPATPTKNPVPSDTAAASEAGADTEAVVEPSPDEPVETAASTPDDTRVGEPPPPTDTPLDTSSSRPLKN